MVSVSNYIGEVTSRNIAVLPQWVSRYDIDYVPIVYYVVGTWIFILLLMVWSLSALFFKIDHMIG